MKIPSPVSCSLGDKNGGTGSVGAHGGFFGRIENCGKLQRLGQYWPFFLVMGNEKRTGGAGWGSSF